MSPYEPEEEHALQLALNALGRNMPEGAPEGRWKTYDALRIHMDAAGIRK